MFKACFVARVDPAEKSINIFCQFRNEDLGTTTDLPNSDNLGKFCFPLGPEQVKAKEYCAPEEYSFTLTGGDGSHLHGFCRCFLPPRSRDSEPKRKNANLRYPQVLCIISPFPWFPFYFKVLQITEALLKRKDLLIRCTDTELPAASSAAQFLNALLEACKGKPQLGRVIKVPLPDGRTNVSPQRRILGLDFSNNAPLHRLLWHLPCGPLMALLQAMLLERRVLFMSAERDTLSAGLHAAAALLYPFRWQHIYLPFLPHSLKDYLTAPMPYLIGIPAPHLLQGLEHMDLEEVVFVDLDAGTCRLGSADGPDMDSALLPWSQRLQAALQILYNMLRSPTEFESTPNIGGCMQEYFRKLLGDYREFIEEDIPDVVPVRTPDIPLPSPGRRQQLQDDGYLKAHGLRFDHLSFVANQRSSEKARNFLDLLRHSQLYEVFINERLALAANSYRTSDPFEAKVVDYMLSKKGKIFPNIKQVGARGIPILAGAFQRTSSFVKSGVSQITRHVQLPGEHGDSGHQSPRPQQETILPSYSIEMDSPKKSALPTKDQSPQEATLPPVVPHKTQVLTAIFDHDHDSDEDAAPTDPALVMSPTNSLSPTKQKMIHRQNNIPSTKSISSELTSPRATGITSGGEGFDNLLNLDGVDGVFRGQSTAQQGSSLNLSINLSLLDEDQEEQMDSGGKKADLSSWGLGLPSISEAATSVANWASGVQAIALSMTGSESLPSQNATPQETTPAQPSTGGRTPSQSYDLSHANSLGTINAFGDFHSPEARRAASSTKAQRTPRGVGSSDAQPIPEAQPISLGFKSASWVPPSSVNQSTRLNGAASGSLTPRESFQRTASTGLEERSSGDPFSVLDPISRPAKASMAQSRGPKSADSGRPQ